MTRSSFQNIGAAVITAFLMLASLGLGNAVAVQEPAPAPTPNADRAPQYQPEAPSGALNLPGPPPAVGEPLVEDTLARPGLLPGGSTCPSGKARAEFVGEGYLFKIAGRCRPESTQAALILAPIPGLELPDGEVRLEAKVVNGGSRTTLWIMVRQQAEPFQQYNLAITPESGWFNLYRETRTPPNTRLAGRSDLASQLSDQDWHAYAIRLDGPRLWAFVDDELMLSVADDTIDRGRVAIGARRLGDPDDDAESAVVLRNLRVSPLAGPSP